MRRNLYIVARRLLDTIRRGREYLRPLGPGVFRNLDPEDIVIKQVTADAVKPLETFLSSGDFLKHRNRMKAQEEGLGLYLVAWHAVPVGHAYVIWGGGEDGPLADRDEGEPFIEDVFVHPAARRKGIGALLMNAAEEAIRKSGYDRVGLVVSINNPLVETMYQKRGYHEAGLGTFESRRIFTDRNGHKRKWSTRVRYWVKILTDREHGNHNP
jgi:GNAT superfamily N-acetyltransferase